MAIEDADIKRTYDRMLAEQKAQLERSGVSTREAEDTARELMNEAAERLERRRRSR